MSTTSEKPGQPHAVLDANHDSKCWKTAASPDIARNDPKSDLPVPKVENVSKLNGDTVSVKEEECDSVCPDTSDGCDKVERICLTSEQLNSLSKNDLIDKWTQQEKFVQFLLEKSSKDIDYKSNESSESTLRTQISELQKKEQYHLMRLSTKENELQDLSSQVDEMKSSTILGNSGKPCLLDPTVNLVYERMKKELDGAKAKMEETQNELAAWKFTPDSNTGKQLMAKCRLLIKENEELGKMISSGKVAKLEGDLALQRNLFDDMKRSQTELDELLQEMEEETEGMQGTILYLQDELRQSKKSVGEQVQHSTNGQTTHNQSEILTGDSVESLKRTSSDNLDEKSTKKSRTDLVENGV